MQHKSNQELSFLKRNSFFTKNRASISRNISTIIFMFFYIFFIYFKKIATIVFHFQQGRNVLQIERKYNCTNYIAWNFNEKKKRTEIFSFFFPLLCFHDCSMLTLKIPSRLKLENCWLISKQPHWFFFLLLSKPL